jgi:hypothetical protein
LAVVLAAMALLVAPPAAAQSGTYTAHACRLPDGSPAGTVGWQAQGEGDIVFSDGCATGGSLAINFRPGTTPHTRFFGSWGEWRFDAPPHTRIVAYSVYRHVTVHGGPGQTEEASEYTHFSDEYTWQTGRDNCNPSLCPSLGLLPGVPRDPGNLVRVENVDFGRIGFHITCLRPAGLNGCPSWPEPAFYLYAADVTLRDSSAPGVVGVAGELSGTLSGRRTVIVRAVDQGSGVHRVQLEVDGVPVAEEPFAPGWPACEKPFPSPVPCPLAGETRATLDTSLIGDGAHVLRVSVTDAAGNRAASEPYAIRVGNAGAACPHGNTADLDAAFSRSRGPELRARAGGRVAIAGRLRGPDGEPIPEASLRVFVRDRARGGYRLTQVVTSNAKGRFRFRVRAASSRLVRLSYCAPGGGAVRHLRLAVSASSEIRARPRVLRNGEAMLLSGRLKGSHVPAAGKLIEIQAFFRGRWRTISSVRSNRRGEWRFRYRFDGTQGRVAYRFRAFLPREAGYPYEPGRSRPVRVVVTGP